MRCPKCHYISFDSNDRCRNCGYEFSLSATMPADALDLPIQTGDEALGPLTDFALSDPEDRSRTEATLPSRGASADRGAPEPPRASAAPRPITSSFDLPLFKDRRVDDDAPLVTPPAVPRAPLSVRRSTPALARSSTRSLADEPELDLDSIDVSEPQTRILPRPTFTPMAEAIDPHGESTSAAAGPRLLAAVIDAIILCGVAAVVLYFTLKVCGLELREAALLPPVPFAAFLCLLAGGYFILFTVAGGQTIGKMAVGIKVVLNEHEGRWSDRVPLGRAVLRAVGYLVSLLPVGLGFLPALFGADRRAVHDRLADTRVVKA